MPCVLCVCEVTVDSVCVVVLHLSDSHFRSGLMYVEKSTSGTNNLDLVYTNIHAAYKAAPCPHLGGSDHISVMLIMFGCILFIEQFPPEGIHGTFVRGSFIQKCSLHCWVVVLSLDFTTVLFRDEAARVF